MPKTLAVSLENRPGAFADVAEILADADVDILGFSTQALGDFGQVHFLVDKFDEAQAALRKAGVRFRTREVVLTEIVDRPGNLSKLARLLADHKVNIEIAFSTVGAPPGRFGVVFEADDFRAAKAALVEEGMPVVESSERSIVGVEIPPKKAKARKKQRKA